MSDLSRRELGCLLCIVLLAAIILAGAIAYVVSAQERNREAGMRAVAARMLPVYQGPEGILTIPEGRLK